MIGCCPTCRRGDQIFIPLEAPSIQISIYKDTGQIKYRLEVDSFGMPYKEPIRPANTYYCHHCNKYFAEPYWEI